MRKNVHNFKNFLLLEAIKNVNKVITDLNIDSNDKDLLRIKELLKKNPNLIGTFLEFRFKEGFPIENIINRIQWILKYPQTVKKLPKNLVDYNSFEELEDDITHLINEIKINDFYKSLYRQTRENIFKLSEDSKKELDLIVSQFMSLSEEKRSEFTPLKYFKMNNVSTSEFTKALKEFVESGSLSFNKETIFEQLESCENYEILIDKDNILLIRSNNINTVRKMGSNKWCIVYDTSNSYAERYFGIDTFNTQFILFNFNLPEYMSNSQFGVTLDKDGQPISGGCQNKSNQYVPFEDILEMTGLSRNDFKLDLERYRKYKSYTEKIKELYDNGDIHGLVNFIKSDTEFVYDIKNIFIKLQLNIVSFTKEYINSKKYDNPIVDFIKENHSIIKELYTFGELNSILNMTEKNIDRLLFFYSISYYDLYSVKSISTYIYNIEYNNTIKQDFENDFKIFLQLVKDKDIFNVETFNLIKQIVIKDIIEDVLTHPDNFENFSTFENILTEFCFGENIEIDLEYENKRDYLNSNSLKLFTAFSDDEYFIEFFTNNLSMFDLKDIFDDSDLYNNYNTDEIYKIIKGIPAEEYLEQYFGKNNAIKYTYAINNRNVSDYMESIECVYDEEEQAYCVMFSDWDKLDGDYFDFSSGYDMSNLYDMFDNWNDYYADLDSILDETSHKFHLEVFRHLIDKEDDIKEEIEDVDNIIYVIDNHKETYEKYKEFKNEELKEIYKEDQNFKSLINFVSDVVSDEDIMNILDDTLGSTLRSIYSTANNQAMENKLFKELIFDFVKQFNFKYFSDGKAYKWSNDSKLLFKIGDFYELEDNEYLGTLISDWGSEFDIYNILRVITDDKGVIYIPDVSYTDWADVVQDVEFDMIEF